MIKVKAIKNELIFEFSLGKKKSILGNKKNELFSIFTEYFSKTQVSEYSKDYKSNSVIYIDDKPLDLKKYMLFDLSMNLFDLISEYKLTQKSLFTMSIETLFESIEIIDRVNTINILLNDLSNEIENIYIKNNVDLRISNLELNKKNILKLIDISLQKDGLLTNQYDYSTNDLNMIKISLLKMISTKNKHFNFIIINYDNKIDDNIFDENENVIFISNSIIDNKVFDTSNKIDFEDEEQLYYLHFNSSSNLCYKDYVTDLLERIIS